MTSRTSVRAQAQRLYREQAAARADLSTSPPSLSLPLKGGGNDCAAAPPAKPTSLTRRVRKLYEESAMPVREIAAVAGVSERSIYKHARKLNWQPRYRWNADGLRPAGAGSGAAVAPVKGAGGRYIRRDAAGQPVQCGLKATDPAAHRRAVAASRQAAVAAEAAARAARTEASFTARLNAIKYVALMADDLVNYRERRAKELRGNPPPDPDDVEELHYRAVMLAAKQAVRLFQESQRQREQGLIN